MSDRSIKVIIIGAGNWAAVAHIPAIQRHPKGEVVGLTKRKIEQARKMAADFSIPFASNDMEGLIQESSPDAAVVSSVAALHYEQAKIALEAGLHVLIEKPMTFTLEEAKQLQQIANKNGLHFLISCPWHYSTHAIEAKKSIRSGEIGEVKMVSELFTNFGLGLYMGLSWDEIFGNHPNPQNIGDPYVKPGLTSYSDPALAGGGQIYCQVSHAAAFLSFLLGQEPVEVHAKFDYMDLEQDVFNVLNIQYESGTIVSMASCLLPGFTDRQHEIRVFGTRGMILLELWKGKLEIHDERNNVRVFPELSEEEAYPMFAPAEDLVDTALGISDNGSPATLGISAMRVIEGACESVRTGKNVIL